jgi:hypothetical protein
VNDPDRQDLDELIERGAHPLLSPHFKRFGYVSLSTIAGAENLRLQGIVLSGPIMARFIFHMSSLPPQTGWHTDPAIKV